MSFADIPLRQNGQEILYSWFNALRTAGTSIEGASSIGETSFTIANGVTDQDVTGLVFDFADVGAAIIDCAIYRKTNTDNRLCTRVMFAHYNAALTAWELVDESPKGGTLDDGVSFSINTTTGQVTYTSESLAGTGYAGKMIFRARTFGAFGI